MMSSDEIPERVEQVHQSLLLFKEAELSSFPYVRILLSGAGFNDKLDPDHLARPVTTTYYYPGGIPGMEQHQRLTFNEADDDLTPEDMDIQRLHQRLKGLKIGREALRRFDSNRSTAAIIKRIDKANAKIGLDSLDLAMQIAEVSQLPLASVEFRKVVKHKYAKPGDYLAVLTSLGLVHPVRALRKVQMSVREDEKLKDPEL